MLGIVCLATVSMCIQELDISITILKLVLIGVLQFVTFCHEQTTIVIGCSSQICRSSRGRIVVREPLLYKVWLSTYTTPVAGHAGGIGCYVSGIYCTSAEEYATPALGQFTVKQDGEYNLILCAVGVVVAHEQQLVSRIAVFGRSAQCITRVNGFLGIGHSILPASGTSIDLCVEVHTHQKHVSCCHISTAILNALGCCQYIRTCSFAYNILHLTFDEVEDFLTRNLYRCFRSHCGNEWRIAKHIHQIIIVECAHETNLSHFMAIFVERRRSVFKEEVAHGDTKHATIIQTTKQSMVVTPCATIELRDTSIGQPGTESLV